MSVLEYRGRSASSGLAMAPLRKIYPVKALYIPENEISDVEADFKQLKEAVQQARLRVDLWKDSMRDRLEDSELAIYDAYDQMLQDPELMNQTLDFVQETKKNSFFAFQKVSEQYALSLLALDDLYLSARADDIRMLTELVIRIGLGQEHSPENWNEQAILVAHHLSTQQLSTIKQENLAGIVLVEGGLTDHTAILAKAMGIPLLIGVENNVMKIANGSISILDSDGNRFIINPSTELIQVTKAQIKEKGIHWEIVKSRAQAKAYTRSGRTLSIEANVGSLLEVEQAKENGAEGIGLFRTELAFLQQQKPLSEEDHYTLYESMLSSFSGVTHTIRLLDFGSDKPLGFMELPKEENPAMGIRALRLGVRNYESLLKPQIRALLRLSQQYSIRILCPMIASKNDCIEIKQLIKKELEDFHNQDHLELEMPPIGIMVEIPNVAIRPLEFIDLADFFSFGTNDLAQFLMAADRLNGQLSVYFEDAKPTLIELIDNFSRQAKAVGKSVSICGEFAADTNYTEKFIDMGVSALSMAPVQIPILKKKISELC
jgi:phosphoenolpyruvate-protein phosphotransferase (PTS system enzyme I)